MTQLSLSSSELTEYFCDGASLEAALEEGIESLGPCRYVYQIFSSLQVGGRSLETQVHRFLTCFKNFIDFALRETLD